MAYAIPFSIPFQAPMSGAQVLLKGEGERWTLECRTYEEPTPEQVASWRARAEWVVAALPRR